MSSEGADVFKALLQGPIEGSPELRSAQQLLSTLMDSLSSAVFWKDLDSCYLGCNQTFADLAGLSIEEMIGKGDPDMPWWSEGTQYLGWDSHVMATGEPVSNIREPLRNSKGEQLWISTNKAPLLDASGNVIGLVGTFRDITAEVLTETESKRTLELLDQRVTERTDQLLRANRSLRKEVDERVRLQAEERRLRTYAEVRREIGASMSRTLDLGKVLDVLVGGVDDLINHDLAAIVLTNDDGRLDLARVESSYGYATGPDHDGSVRLEQHPSLIEPGTPAGESDGHIMLGALGPARSTIAAEMVTGGVLIGYIILESRWSDFYVAEHGERLRGLAEQASAVISNVRLNEQAAELAATAERDRLRRDLHDSVVQTLAAAALTVDTELVHMAPDDPVRPAFERIQRLSAHANSELRDLLREMRPAPQAEVDLIDLITRSAGQPDWPFAVDLTMNNSPDATYSHVAHGLYRIMQEALNNAAQHSRARRVFIDFKDEPRLELTVRDDGLGFDPAAVRGDHLGLSIMAERAAELGGTLDVRSKVGDGTTISITVEASMD